MQLNDRDMSEIPSTIKKLFEKMEEHGLKPAFGLRQQGHFETVERMRSEGKTLVSMGYYSHTVGSAHVLLNDEAGIKSLLGV